MQVRPSAVLVLATLLSGCGRGMPYRWTDTRTGAEVYSDFEGPLTRAMLAGEVGQRMDALQRLFGVDKVAGLQIFVHDRARWPFRGDITIGGWHDGNQVHVGAGWELGIPNVEYTSTLLHEFVHALVRRSGLDLPRWFEEGLCEVLSESRIDADGRLVWMPNGDRERAVRELQRRGQWLAAERLFAFVNDYPKGAETIAVLYAEATSFVWSLVEQDPPRDRAAIAALADMPTALRKRRFANWEQSLGQTSVPSLFRPFLSSASASVRHAVVSGIDQAVVDKQWWADAARLLADPSQNVRRAMRLEAIFRPANDDLSVRRYRIWCEAEPRAVRLAGQLALGQCGDLDAALSFCRALTRDDVEWAQPLLWLVLCVPAAEGGRRKLPRLFDRSGAKLQAYAQAMADELEELRGRLVFDRGRAAYRLR